VVIGRAALIYHGTRSLHFPLPFPSLALIHTPLKREVAQQLHTPLGQPDDVALHYTLVPSLELRTGPACEAGLSVGMRRKRLPPHRRKKEEVLQ